jgi:hypothetical protein
MGERKVQVANTFRLQPGEVFLTTLEHEERYKVSRATQCRHRKEGSGPPFVVYNGKILYPESGIIAWMNERLMNSTAKLSPEARGGRYAHLPAAREKAIVARRVSSPNAVLSQD